MRQQVPFHPNKEVKELMEQHEDE